MIDLETLQNMWKNDTKIDRDNLHEESLNTPTLHAKYFEVYNNVFLLRAKQRREGLPFTTADTNITQGRLTQRFTSRTPFQRRSEIKKLLQSIWKQMRNSQQQS